MTATLEGWRQPLMRQGEGGRGRCSAHQVKKAFPGAGVISCKEVMWDEARKLATGFGQGECQWPWEEWPVEWWGQRYHRNRKREGGEDAEAIMRPVLKRAAERGVERWLDSYWLSFQNLFSTTTCHHFSHNCSWPCCHHLLVRNLTDSGRRIWGHGEVFLKMGGYTTCIDADGEDPIDWGGKTNGRGASCRNLGLE